MIYAIVFLTISLIATIAFTVIDEDHNGYCYGLFGGVIISVLAVIIASHIEGPSPTPLDVYRGRTTLQITYKDSTAIDTVVVFKNEFMEKNK